MAAIRGLGLPGEQSAWPEGRGAEKFCDTPSQGQRPAGQGRPSHGGHSSTVPSSAAGNRALRQAELLTERRGLLDHLVPGRKQGHAPDLPVDVNNSVPFPELHEPKCQGYGPNQLPALLQDQNQAWVPRVGWVKGLCEWPLTTQSPPSPWEPSPIRLAAGLDPRDLTLPRWHGPHPATSKARECSLGSSKGLWLPTGLMELRVFRA